MRLALTRDFSHVRLAGTSGDGGADVTCTKNGKRWLFQVKRWQSAVGTDVVAETLEACRRYNADIPVIVSRKGFTTAVRTQQTQLAGKGVALQLWDRAALLRQANMCLDEPLTRRRPDEFELRSYQSDAVDRVMADFLAGARSALVVLATGLGKTYVAATSIGGSACCAPVPRHSCSLIATSWCISSKGHSGHRYERRSQPEFGTVQSARTQRFSVSSISFSRV